MIILRTKYFSRRDIFSKELKDEFSLNFDLLNKAEDLTIDVVPTNTFTKQFKKTLFKDADKINKFKKSLKKYPMTWFNDENPGDDTHYLADMSNTKTTIQDKRSVVFSKKINNKNRFNYRIYKPILIKDKKTGKLTYYQKIVLCSCSEHTINGMPGSYVKGQIGNVWNNNKGNN